MSDETNTSQETAETPIPQDTGVNMGSEPANTPSEPLNAPVNADTPIQAKD